MPRRRPNALDAMLDDVAARRSNRVLCASYARRSEADDDWGIKDQHADNRRRAEARGWIVVAELDDNDVSASTFSRSPRPGYNELCRMLKAGEITAVAATETNRIHRRQREWHQFKELNPRLQIATRSTYINLATREGVVEADVRATFDEESSRETSKRLLQRTVDKARNGNKPRAGGYRLYGYTSDYQQVPEEAAVVERMARMLLEGDSPNGIATTLNREKIRTTTGALWNALRVKRVLSSLTIAGIRRYDPILRPDEEGFLTTEERRKRKPQEKAIEVSLEGVEPILDRETWDRVQTILDFPGRRVPFGATVEAPRRWLLSGWLECGNSGCIGRYRGHGRGQRGGGVYRCEGCQMSRVAEAIDEHVTEAVLYRLSSPAMARSIKRKAEAAAKRGSVRAETLTREIDRLRHKAEQARNDYAEDLISRPDWLAIVDDCRRKMAAAEAELSKLDNGAVVAALNADDLRATWDAASLDWKRSLLKDVITRLVVLPRPPGDTSRLYDPDLLVIEWDKRWGG